MATLHFDGGSRDQKLAGSGFFIKYNNKIIKGYDYIGNKTSNQAEYYGLIRGLEEAIKNKITDLVVYGDSKLVISQMSNKWRIASPNLIEAHKIAKKLTEKFKKIEFNWIPREENGDADILANMAMNLKTSKTTIITT